MPLSAIITYPKTICCIISCLPRRIGLNTLCKKKSLINHSTFNTYRSYTDKLPTKLYNNSQSGKTPKDRIQTSSISSKENPKKKKK
jgi:hypothetical protein